MRNPPVLLHRIVQYGDLIAEGVNVRLNGLHMSGGAVVPLFRLRHLRPRRLVILLGTAFCAFPGGTGTELLFNQVKGIQTADL